MKSSFAKALILLSFFEVLTAGSFAASSNDTIINYVFVNNQIKLVSGEGDLYQFAVNQDGYKYIYYLFTDCNYLHLDSTDVKTSDSYYCLFDGNQSAQWYNSETKGTAKSSVIWTLQYKGNKEGEFVKNNPHRFLHRLTKYDPVGLVFNVNNKLEMKNDTTSVLLYLMPCLSKSDGKCIQKTHLSNGGIVAGQEQKSLNLNWKKAEALWWVFLIVIVSLIVLIIAVYKVRSRIMKKDEKKDDNSQQDKTCTDESSQKSNEEGQNEEGQNEEGQNEEGQNEESQNEESQNEESQKTEKKKSFFAKLLNRPDGQKTPETTQEKNKRLEDDLRKEKKKLKNLSSQLAGLQKQLATANANLKTALKEKENAEKAKDNAVKEAKAEFDIEKAAIEDDCNKQVTAAQKDRDKKVQAAEKERDEKVADVVKDCDEKVKAAKDEVQQAIDDAATAIKAQKIEFARQLRRWIDDKDSMLDQLICNANHLRDIVKQMPPEAFNGNCDKIMSGANFFADNLSKIIDSEEWQEMTTIECMSRLRSDCCNTISNSTDSWINLLGRLYSYMSVSQLRDQLSIEGLSFELVSDAFTTIQAIMTSVGIVVLNCSIGFDSGNDPVTSSLFDNNSAIDRITKWLGSNEAVSEAVANHGRTVYDFGQLAYFTSDDLEIHKGSVIFYNS